jgi:deoxyribodipyrimidine photolyase
LEDLRKSLKKQGSNLIIRFGNAENVIKELVLEVGSLVAVIVVTTFCACSVDVMIYSCSLGTLS